MSEGPRGREEQEEDLKDVLKEETSRGRKQPKKAISIARERMIREVARLLANPNCDRETFLETIHEYGLTDESLEYHQLLALWRRRHGNG